MLPRSGRGCNPTGLAPAGRFGYHAAVLTFHHRRGRVDLRPAWTTSEIHTTIADLLAEWEHRLPASRDARVVIKPNLNNDLVALSGNCADLRVLDALLDGLRRRGYHALTVADGSNVGVERRNINTFTRLRVVALAERHGARVVNLNQDEGERVSLQAGGQPVVGRTILESDFLISVPKIKTHAEAGMSCALKNWVGIARGQMKRHMHFDLAANIVAMNEVVLPDLILVDGIVGMEGNGPGDGDPFRFGQLLMSDDAFLNDVVVARLIDMPLSAVGYLQVALERGHIDEALVQEVAAKVPILRPIRRAPPRTRLAELSEARQLEWLKRAVRPIVSRPRVTELAYKLKIIQDVYSLDDDSLRLVGRDVARCGACRRCEDFCPTELPLSAIGVRTEAPDCVQCLYCWWVCPQDALRLEGQPNAMKRQIERYKPAIEQM